MNRFWISIVLFLCVCGCRPEDVQEASTEGSASASESVPAAIPQPSEPIKSKPTWETRTLKDWRQPDCQAGKDDCKPMGRATVLAEFVHNGCRTYRQRIENQAAIVKGYAPEHHFLLIVAASDAFTRALYDTELTKEPPCRVFFYDDTMKPDKKLPNEDQWFVELCKDTTNITDQECGSQLIETRLYAP